MKSTVQIFFLYAAGWAAASGIQTGNTFTSIYYDCCKPACAWDTAGAFSSPLQTCDKFDNPLPASQGNAASWCDGGPASVCTNQQPWAINDTFSYGFASIYIRGDNSPDWCCSCYELDFIDSPIKGKKMIVQGININYNEQQMNFFSLTVPGWADWDGACQSRFGSDFNGFFGTNSTVRNITSLSVCDDLPDSLKPSCQWRYNWYQNAYNPNATFARVSCPAELTNITGCTRRDESMFDTTGVSSNATDKPSSSSFTQAMSFSSGLLVLLACLIIAIVMA